MVANRRQTKGLWCSAVQLTAECSTIELPGIISIFVLVTEYFQAEAGDMGDMGVMICNNREETDYGHYHILEKLGDGGMGVCER